MRDKFTRKWIIEKSIPIVQSYDQNITLRGLHYRLVVLEGMTNTMKNYKRVVSAMIQARWDGLLDFSDFVDHDRETLGETESKDTDVYEKIDDARDQIKAWMRIYSKNRWENQPVYPEVFIEKKALIGVFQDVCRKNAIALNPCKGYPSLTFINDAAGRFQEAINNGKEPVILYFGDYDPSGEDIPRSIEDNLARMGVIVEVRRIALMEQQVLDWDLPPAPAKITDSRTATWDGLGQVELDAVEPNELMSMCQHAIDEVFDDELHIDLLNTESKEKEKYQKELKKYVNSL